MVSAPNVETKKKTNRMYGHANRQCFIQILARFRLMIEPNLVNVFQKWCSADKPGAELKRDRRKGDKSTHNQTNEMAN